MGAPWAGRPLGCCFWSFSVSPGLFHLPQTGSTVPWFPVLLVLSHFPSHFLIFLSSLDPTSVSHLLSSPVPAPTVSSPLLACPFSGQTLHLAASGASGLSTQAPAGEGPHMSCVVDHLVPVSGLGITAPVASVSTETCQQDMPTNRRVFFLFLSDYTHVVTNYVTFL